MADFPSSIYSPRTKTNRLGVVYDVLKSKIIFAEDIQKLDAEVVALETLAQPKFAEIHIDDATASQSIPTGTGYTKITLWTDNGLSENATPDQANNKITITKAGKYLVNGSFNFSAGTANLTWRGALFLDGVEQDKIHWKRNIKNASESGSASFTGIITVPAVPKDIDLRVRHSGGASANIVIEYANLNIHQVG